MRNNKATVNTPFVMSLCSFIILSVLSACHNGSQHMPSAQEGPDEYPGEWMYRQRAFPEKTINHEVYQAAIVQANLAKQVRRSGNTTPWQSVGPVNIGGRITDITLHPTNQNVMVIGTSNGGVFRTDDGGQSWDHIYENDGRLSIGNIEISPSNPDIIYIGTGEANGSATSGAFFGDGVYRSENGGATWTNLGLPESNHVGRIVVDPEDPDRVFVAATGQLYGKDNDRGIYRTLNGGLQWEQVLFVNDSTSAIDVAMNPLHPDTLYAAFWDRIRYQNVRDYAGPSSGIYRTFDGGETWTHLVNGLPVNDLVGRIGLAVAPSDPDVVYAIYSINAVTNDFEGLYKSIDAGETWVRIDDGTLEAANLYSGFGWYFGNVRVDPSDPDRVHVLGLHSWTSEDGGVTWVQQTFNDVHVDHHALEIHSQNPDLQVLGTDGGLYISKDRGFEWEHVETLPITEFYTCEFDESLPFRYYGGAQDNGTLRTLTGNTDDWERIFGGDGFYVIVDPTDNNIMYCEYQWGNLFKSTDGGFEWEYALNGVNGFDRTNWNTPVVMSPQNHNRLYYGTHRLYTSDDGAMNWTLMSDDLTNTSPESPGGEGFGALSTIAVAPSDSNVIYTGSEDGYVYVTFDHGNQWQRISDDLPERYVTHVAVDQYDAMVAYVTISGYRMLDYLPHIFRTTNGGETWEDISGDLPEVPLNDVVVDPDLPGTLYVASDLGVWYTDDLGLSWYLLGEGLPMTSYNALDFHAETRQLLAASFGLSIWIYDLGEPVTAVSTVSNAVLNLYVYPNPIRDHTTISFEVNRAESMQITVYDIAGKLVATIASGSFSAGKHHLDWQPDFEAGLYIIHAGGLVGNSSRIVEVY